MSTVFLVSSNASDPQADIDRKLSALWREASLGSAFRPQTLAALKFHAGEPGTTTFVKPAIVKSLVRLIAAEEAKPFLTDSSVLYKSPRDNAIGHAKVVVDHGFGADVVGAPFISADGLSGSDAEEIPIDGKHFQNVSIGSAILHARSMLVLSHATGHLGTGFGGTIKNLGMGCCSKKSKLRQHHGQQPHVATDTCTGCAVCKDWCPTDSITVDDTATILNETCIGCGECIAVCQEGSIAFDWSVAGPELQERIVEHATAVVRSKPGHISYVTVAQQITKNCDCLGVSEEPLLDDIGILASHDPVALDQAILDLVREKAGQTLESMAWPQLDASHGLRYAEELGIGTREYQLKRVEV